MKQSTPSIVDKRTSTRLKEAVERLTKASEAELSLLTIASATFENLAVELEQHLSVAARNFQGSCRDSLGFPVLLWSIEKRATRRRTGKA
eukprot:g903.t1